MSTIYQRQQAAAKREKGGVAVLERAPKAKAGGGRVPPGRPPVEVAAAGDGPRKTFLVTVPEDVVRRLEVERARRGLRSRNDVVVVLLEEGLK